MEDVLTETPPPSRFFPEDLDNFATPPPHLPSPFLLLNPNPNPNTNSPLLNPSLLLIAISAPSLFLLHRTAPKTLVGNLFLPEIPLSGNAALAPSPRDRSCNLYAVDRPGSSPAVLAAVQYPVAPERSRAVAKSLLGGVGAERVLILDAIRSENYRGRLAVDEALVFKLETAEQRRSGDPVVRGVEFLPSGSVMDGLGAAILAECQVRRVKATLLATWPESGPTSVVQTLSRLFRELGLDVGEIDGKDDSDAGFGPSFRHESDLYT
uniref:Proteasome assembly chaperone 1 n=1 Tax=Ananas comosus var. bracteatus TaxID=296719 RepID=A0A6V7QJG9_ANACO|nr:unnamed protein product [Ananas comosus var. bracteatus]